MPFKFFQIKFDAIIFFLLIFFWLGLTFNYLTHSPMSFPDTAGYISNPNFLDEHFSLSGNAQRGWPTVLLYWIAKNDNFRVLLQLIIYGISWSLLINAWLKNKNQKYKILAGSLMVVLALTPRFSQWNMMLISESLSMSLIILAFAFCKISFNYFESNGLNSNKLGVTYLFVSISFFSLSAVNRASLLLLSFLPFLLIIYVTYKFRIHKFLVVTLLITTIISVLYPLKYNSKTNEFWSGNGDHLSRSSFYFMLNTAEGGAQPEWSEKLWSDITNQAPYCLLEFKSSGIDDSRSPWYMSDLMAAKCQPGVHWLNENFERSYYKFILNNPGDSAKYLFSMTRKVNDDEDYPANTILPKSLPMIFESTYEKQHSFQPVIGWLIVGLISLIYLFLSKQKVTGNTLISALFFLFGYASVGLTLFIIITEPVRITTPATLITMLGSVLLFSEAISKNKVTINYQE